MGEVDRITCRTAAALLATFAALAALPAAAAAAPPTCAEPFTLIVEGDAPALYEATCTGDDGATLAYAVATGEGDPQPAKGSVVAVDEGVRYTPQAGESGADAFAFTASDGTDTSVPYTVTVTIRRPPSVTVAPSSASATTGQALAFTATADDPDGGEITYAWAVDGDPVPGEVDPSFTHSFPSAGEYIVSVTVTDDEGATSTASSTVQISDPPNEPPLAAFAFAPARPVAGELVTFTSGAGDPEGGELRLAWDLDGDRAFDDATGRVATIVYATPGRRVVRLRATDPEDAETVAERTVEVVAAPLPATQPSQPPPAAPPPPSPPPPVIAAIAADTTAPAFGVSRRPGQRLRRVRRRGLRFSVRCDEPCSVYLELLVSRKTARRLGIDRRARLPVRIGRVTTTAGPERRPVTVKLARRAARRLRRARRVTLTLQGSAFDAGGYTTLLKPRPLVIRR